MEIRKLRDEEWDTVGRLIFASTNSWYQRNLNRACFPGDDPSVCRVFPEVYEGLDPGCCLVAEDGGALVGSCFYHPRETHVSLGIMNVVADSGGKGVAGALLDEVIKRADGLPIRLVSSAMNLDSYSLYTRAGFAPLALYQDMFFPGEPAFPDADDRVRPASMTDVADLVALEDTVSGIRRPGDFERFIQNSDGIWGGSVVEGNNGIEGFLFSVDHPGSQMLGPGIMLNTGTALALIAAEQRRFAGRSPIFLVPAAERELVAELYALGARNCELHVSQVLGDTRQPGGIVMPSFMPETG